MHWLIPYVYLRHHHDPKFDEFTYGDSGLRAAKLKESEGQYLFFHTTKDGKKYITAYYVVDRVLDTFKACENANIVRKYKSPHILEHKKGQRPSGPDDPDAIAFGDPITSYVLDKPLPFTREVAERLTLGSKAIGFHNNRTEAQVIASATRNWRTLTDQDVEVLLEEIGKLQESTLPIQPLRSTEEVAQTIEKDVEDHIANNPEMIAEDLKLVDRQKTISVGRIDLLLKDKAGDLVVVEVKLNRIGRRALRQIRSYMDELSDPSNSGTLKKVSGVIVCSGVMRAFENDLRKQTKVRILVYGWELNVKDWPCESPRDDS